MRGWEKDRYGGDDGEGGEGDQAEPGIKQSLVDKDMRGWEEDRYGGDDGEGGEGAKIDWWKKWSKNLVRLSL